MLLGSDDDSSGDEAAAAPAPAAPAPAPVAAPAAPAAPPATAMPAPSPRGGKSGKDLAAARARADAKAAAEKRGSSTDSGGATGTGQQPQQQSQGESEVTRRLKSLYGPAAEAHQAQAQQAAAAPPSSAASASSASSLVANMDIEPTSLSSIRQKEQQKQQHAQQQQQARAQRQRQQQQQQLHHHNHPPAGGGGSRRSSGGSIGSGSEVSSHGGGGGRSAYPPQYSQSQQSSSSGGSGRYHGGSGGSSGGGDYSQEKKKKEQFLMFTRVLMKYLESKDAAMHRQAKNVIKVCAERNKQGDPKYASLTSSMRTELRQVVGETYWRKAEDYLKHFLQTKGAEAAARALAPQQQQRGPPTPQQQQQRPRSPATSKSKAGSAIALTSQQKKAEEKKRAQEEALARVNKQQKKPPKGKGPSDTKKAASQQQARSEIQKAAQLLNMQQRGQTPPSHLAATAAALLAGGKVGGGSSVASASSYGAGDKLAQELMEYLDHAVRYDQASCSILLSKDYREDIDIQREQKRLLFGDDNSLGKVIRVPPSAGRAVGDTEAPAPYKGWSNRNIVSARTVWAKVRLPENEAAATPDRPLLPGEKSSDSKATDDTEATDGAETSAAVHAQYEWFNEIRAEEDETLTLLSEATEMYVRSLLEGSINQARQRQNLDGVRLWYAQHNGTIKAPLCLRLGCDVKRQEALATANAAMTVKRMEEALGRQKLPQSERNLNSNETLYKATSMSDLAKRPRLARAPERAEFDAKRSFEQYSGKDSGAPPLGRVPKRVRISQKDITSCLQDPQFPWKRKRTVAANI